MFSQIIIILYALIKKSGIRGRGLLLRTCVRVFPGLRAYRFRFSSGLEATLDLASASNITLLEFFCENPPSDPLFKSMEELLNENDVLWDVGANVGAVSIHFAASRFKLSEIHSFEPNPEIYSQLKEILSQPADPSIKVHPFGLGVKDETMTLNLTETGTLCGSLVRQHQAGRCVEVEIRNGDQYRKSMGIAPPDVIKIDVEAFEAHVLAGLRETISEFRPIIFMEHFFHSDEDLAAIIPGAYELIFILNKGGLVRSFNGRKSLSANCILIPNEKLALLRSPVVSDPAFSVNT